MFEGVFFSGGRITEPPLTRVCEIETQIPSNDFKVEPLLSAFFPLATGSEREEPYTG